MKSLSRNLLVGAMLAALPLSGAMACTVSQWNSASDTATDVDNALGPVNSGAPANRQGRYSGLCSLRAPANAGDPRFVTDNHPVNDAAYNARFYVYTGATGGTAKVFAAYTADDAGGTEAIGVTYNAGSGSIDFAAGGQSGSVTGIAANKWYSVELAYESGTSFTATVEGGGAGAGFGTTPFSETYTAGAAPAAATIESASLGFISGTASAGNIRVDEFESTRGVAIGRLPPGDANNSGTCNASDYAILANDIVTTLINSSNVGLSAGQPDCNEDGGTNATDYACLADRIVEDLLSSTTCGE